MNKPVYLVLSMLEISKTVTSKFGEKAKLCQTSINSFTVYIKTEDIYADIAKDVETRFNTSNYELERPSGEG